ncbi:hypothetical protein [Pelosinus sp. UFO1]|uniref:hypothetical protein n=1 Tax=Pelosinus sp. UFO1 TaxID=484770 RepID=UPI0004D0F70C|nr:hypothetical protein [Pelosinus sp. UFO1]AIF53640.1 hypothetical protein UFO1_4097 [Pelosinus sp. UFO1]
MYAICIEASHLMGNGHLFRAMNFAMFLKECGHDVLFLINDNEVVIRTLKYSGFNYVVVELSDYHSNWEGELIDQYDIAVWINDRLDTKLDHSKKVKGKNTFLVTFDDLGSGAVLADIHVAALIGNNASDLHGKVVLRGIEYLILNKEIDKYKRARTVAEKYIVTLGGSDTYGVTITVMNILRQRYLPATIILGPSFQHEAELRDVMSDLFTIKRLVPSLMAEFYQHDIAVTGGGITSFEACASGLPCIVIANEIHEIPNAQLLHDLGVSVFAGHYKEIDAAVFGRCLDVHQMSKCALDILSTNAADKIYEVMYKCLRK